MVDFRDRQVRAMAGDAGAFPARQYGKCSDIVLHAQIGRHEASTVFVSERRRHVEQSNRLIDCRSWMSITNRVSVAADLETKL
jgi:hypothetical protein